MSPPIRPAFSATVAGRWHRDSIVLRRGTSTIPAQPGRVVRSAVGSEARSDGGQASQGRVLVYGGPSLNIAVKDRLTVNGVVYVVTMIRPDRSVETVAETEVQQ